MSRVGIAGSRNWISLVRLQAYRSVLTLKLSLLVCMIAYSAASSSSIGDGSTRTLIRYCDIVLVETCEVDITGCRNKKIVYIFIGVAVKKLENGAFTFAEQAVGIQQAIFSEICAAAVTLLYIKCYLISGFTQVLALDPVRHLLQDHCSGSSKPADMFRFSDNTRHQRT